MVPADVLIEIAAMLGVLVFLPFAGRYLRGGYQRYVSELRWLLFLPFSALRAVAVGVSLALALRLSEMVDDTFARFILWTFPPCLFAYTLAITIPDFKKTFSGAVLLLYELYSLYALFFTDAGGHPDRIAQTVATTLALAAWIKLPERTLQNICRTPSGFAHADLHADAGTDASGSATSGASTNRRIASMPAPSDDGPAIQVRDPEYARRLDADYETTRVAFIRAWDACTRGYVKKEWSTFLEYLELFYAHAYGSLDESAYCAMAGRILAENGFAFHDDGPWNREKMADARRKAVATLKNRSLLQSDVDYSNWSAIEAFIAKYDRRCRWQ